MWAPISYLKQQVRTAQVCFDSDHITGLVFMEGCKLQIISLTL